MSAHRPETTRLHIDWTRCDGRGLCSELLPGLLARDDWGYPLAPAPGDPVLHPDDIESATDAATLCPRVALTVVTTPAQHRDLG
ncbi:ferredoxin [Nocardia alni]|uniref:ferredoxin n=1 Tax=Nocardia alni TaxID=2815723 RepID=UPI001C2190C6|nr:ferredoxin [Nocardia alni]